MQKKLSFWNLLFLNIAIVVSLQQIPSTAIYGASIVSLFFIAALCFFIPTIVMTVFFTKQFNKNGGSYLWVSAAYGKVGGFFVVCNQWLSNLIWYPTIFSLIAVLIANTFDINKLENSKRFILMIQLGTFWGITALNFLGLKISTCFSDLCSILGIFFPTLLSMFLACFYLFHNHPPQISFQFHNLFPSINHLSDISYMIQIIVSLIGIEMSAVHTADVANSQHNYQKSLWISGFIALLLLMGTSLAISIVVPNQQISVISGLIDAFSEFFSILQLKHFLKFTLWSILLGTLGTVAAWMLSSTRAMQIGSSFCHLPKFFQKTNRFGAPIGILILECIIFTMAVILFNVMPSINTGFWLLITISSQSTLIYYILLFLTAIKLSNQTGLSFKIKKIIFNFMMALGIFTCIIGIAIGFIPPQGHVNITNLIDYLAIVSIGLLSLLLIPLLLYVLLYRNQRTLYP